MRILGLDIGTKRIGAAISDPLGITAQSLKTIAREPFEESTEEIKKIISEFDVTELIVGLPINMNGTKGKGADEVVEFVERLKEKIDKPIKLWDERLTTMEAEKILIESDVSRKKRKGVKDKLAAQLILQSYLACRKEKNV